MSLKDDIKQKEFKTESQKALINVIYTYNHIIGQMNSFFKENDITRQQYNVLRILRGQSPQPATINLIKERMLDKMSDASRIVKRLEAKELVAKITSKTDKRLTQIKISEQGLELLASTDEKARGFEHIFDNLTTEETTTLNLLLDKLRGSK
ncbi:MarR family transcriptional regulator [Fulvivirga sp. RKSG066]|uniref:MarR family winged helix-turn-helix transcriptional regulator n=1 Tax=Fulvivirga aurantia TaxID=2529383 RepID=UPI0012BC40D6|nr:MarR family transcriptional regulator [Fulvivirga aurantia]MTI22685.1 MarR family transcriptional regulator [Fulvivirga aurantia]